MSSTVKSLEDRDRAIVRLRGLWWLAAGSLMAVFPFVWFGALAPTVLSPRLNDAALWVFSIFSGAVALALPLAPIAIVAGVIDLLWPRITPSSGLEL